MHPEHLHALAAEHNERLRAAADHHRLISQGRERTPATTHIQKFGLFAGLLLLARRPNRKARARARAARLPALDDRPYPGVAMPLQFRSRPTP